MSMCGVSADALEGQRWQISWNWNYRQLGTFRHECWKPNSDPKQYTLLTIEPSLQAQR